MYLLGIDNGSTVIKAGIFDYDGNEIAVFGSKIEVLTPKPGFYERKIEDIWQANINAISGVLKKADLTGQDIAALAITGHGNGLHLIDAEGAAVYPAIEGTDSRALDYVNRWLSDGTFERVLPKTMQSLWPAQPAALLAWMKANEPRVIEKTKWLFMIKDYVRYKLTGEAYAELTDISATSIFNVKDVKYDPDLLTEFGIQDLMHIMPPVRNSTDICGHITKEASRLTGLAQGTPVAGGLFDVDAAAISTGITDSTKLNIIAGTWCNNQYISSKPVVSKELFMTSVFCIPGYWLILEGSATSASNLEWFVTEFLAQEKKIAEREGISVYALCDREVAETDPAESEIVFLPFLYGSNAGQNAKSVFLGLDGQHKRGHVIRSIYEGIAFSHRTHIEKLMQHRKLPEIARIAGGAARSDVWVQMFADILNMPIEITRGTELGTMGAALCAGVGAGIFSDFGDGVHRMVNVIGHVDPNGSHTKIYDRKYARYQQAIAALEGFWD
jgi:L-xylulokinase